MKLYGKQNRMRRLLFLTLFMALGVSGLVHAQEISDFQGEEGYLAIFYPLKSATLCAEVSGLIKNVKFDMGETFKRGNALIVLDADYLRAEKMKTEATQSYCASVYQTKKQLYQQKSVSTLELVKAEADYKIARANFDIARKRLDASTIKAPYSGKVVKNLVRENEFVTEGQPLLEIIDDSVIRVKCHLPLSFYKDLRVGQKYRVLTKDFSSFHECRITQISPVVESNTSSFQVFGEIDNTANIIRVGMTGYLRIDSIGSE